MKKKICFIISNYNNGGGTERVTSQIANGLVNRGFDVSILSIGQGNSPVFWTDPRVTLFEMNDPVLFRGNHYNDIGGVSGIIYRFYLHMKARVSNFSLIKNLKNKLLDIKPDTVIVVDVSLYRYLFPLQKRLNFKTVAWEHFCLDMYNGSGTNFSRFLATKYAEKVIVLSDNDLESYKAKYPNCTNLQRIYNPIAFDISDEININNKIVIAAGRLTHQKGFDMLIKAWSYVEKKEADWELRIYGTGEEEENLHDQIRTNGLTNVKLCGYTAHLDEELNKGSIFAFSSRYEGWGLVLIEALAKGLPCVSFDCKHGPAEILDDEVNGFLVEPDNIDVFADKLLCLMQNKELRERFSNNCQKDLGRFDPEVIASQWESLLNKI